MDHSLFHNVQKIEEYSFVKAFLDEVCSFVRAKAIHPDIRQELISHLEDRVEALMAEGQSLEDSLQSAVAQMGAPNQIGRRLDHAHRPLTDWKLLFLIALFAAVGLIGALNVQFMDTHSSLNGQNFIRVAFFMGIGLLFFAAFYYADYRKIKRYSDSFFLGLLILNILSNFNGFTTINGIAGYLSVGFFTFNMISLSVLPLLIVYSGTKPAGEWGKAEGLYRIFCQGVLPTWIYIYANQTISAIMYLTGFIVLTWITKRSRAQFFNLVTLPALLLCAYLFTRQDYLRDRIANSFGADAYTALQTIEAVRSAGWFGQGFAALNTGLPYIFNDYLIPYLIYCFGWSFALLLGLMVTLLLARMWRIRNAVNDVYGRLMMTAIIVIFGFRLIWPFLSAFGLLPPVSMVIPFIGYGGALQILDLSAIGLLLSIYRRKNITSSLVYRGL